MIRSLPLLAFLWAIACTGGASATAAELVISEFMAANFETITDEDGDSSDWLEIRNTGVAAVDLDGWYLTDNDDDLRRWRCPSVRLEGGAYLLIFASGKDRRDAAGELHTNFGLSASGEYLALVMPDGVTVAHAFLPP